MFIPMWVIVILIIIGVFFGFQRTVQILFWLVVVYVLGWLIFWAFLILLALSIMLIKSLIV